MSNDNNAVTVGVPAIACDLTDSPDTAEERMAEYARLFDRALAGRERTDGGVRLRFRADDGVEAWVRDLVTPNLSGTVMQFGPVADEPEA